MRFRLACILSILLLTVAGYCVPGERPQHPLMAVAFSQGDASLLVSDLTGVVHVLHLPDLKEVKAFKAGYDPKRLVPFGTSSLAVGAGTSGLIIDLKTRKQIRSLGPMSDAVTDVAVSPDGHLVALGVYNQHGALFDLKTGAQLGTLPGNSMAFSPDGAHLAVGGTRGKLAIYNVKNNKLERSIAASDKVVNNLAYDSSGKTLAAGCGDHLVHLFDPQTGKAGVTLKMDNPIDDMAFSPDGKHLFVSALEPMLAIFSLPDGTQTQVHGQFKFNLGVAWSHDGKYMASVSYDGSAHLWNPAGTQVAEYRVSSK